MIESGTKSGNFCSSEEQNIVHIKQVWKLRPSASFMSYFWCPRGTLLSTVPVIHIDPFASIPVYRWRQYCYYRSTSRALAIRIDGVETVGAHIGDLWENLETLSGRWEEQQQPSFNSEGPWKRNLSINTGAIRVGERHMEREVIYYHLQNGDERTFRVWTDFGNASHNSGFHQMFVSLFTLFAWLDLCSGLCGECTVGE